MRLQYRNYGLTQTQGVGAVGKTECLRNIILQGAAVHLPINVDAALILCKRIVTSQLTRGLGSRSADRIGIADSGSDTTYRGVRHYGLCSDFHPSLLHDCSHKAHRHKRGQTYGEQVGGYAEIGMTQHIGSESEQCSLTLTLRFHYLGSGNLRHRQRPAVDLTVGGQLHLLQWHYDGGHHKLGERFRHKCAQCLGIQRGTILRGVVTHKVLCAANLLHHSTESLDSLMSGGNSLDLAKLDAESTQFDHAIHTTDELYLTIGSVATLIPCAVCLHAINRDEFLSGKVRTVKIAHTYPVAHDYDLTGKSGGERI